MKGNIFPIDHLKAEYISMLITNFVMLPLSPHTTYAVLLLLLLPIHKGRGHEQDILRD